MAKSDKLFSKLTGIKAALENSFEIENADFVTKQKTTQRFYPNEVQHLFGEYNELLPELKKLDSDLYGNLEPLEIDRKPIQKDWVHFESMAGLKMAVDRIFKMWDSQSDLTTEKISGREIFISHSSGDKFIVNSFIDDILIGVLGIKMTNIFCTSTDGAKITSGEDWRSEIRSNLISSKVTFLIISPNYKESEVCQNEMGAAWVLSSRVLPLIIEPINFKTVGIIQEPKQIEKLFDESSLDRIKDIIQEEFEIPPNEIKSDRWTAKKKEFLIKCKKHLKENPFDKAFDKSEFQELQKENKALEATVESLIEEKQENLQLIEALQQAKDKDEVREIMKDQMDLTDYEEFTKLTKEVRKELNKYESIIVGIIFKNYTGKDVQINWQGNRSELDDGLSRGYYDEEFDINWDNPKMKRVDDKLDELSRFISRTDLTEDFFETYEGEFDDVPFELNNMDFWESVIGSDISFK